jgi:hypothetical protein
MQCMPRIIHLGLYSRGIREAAAANREAQRPKAIAHGANSIAAPFVCSHRHGCWTPQTRRPIGIDRSGAIVADVKTTMINTHEISE